MIIILKFHKILIMIIFRLYRINIIVINFNYYIFLLAFVRFAMYLLNNFSWRREI